MSKRMLASLIRWVLTEWPIKLIAALACKVPNSTAVFPSMCFD